VDNFASLIGTKNFPPKDDYLQEREENEATEELIRIPGFEEELREAIRETDAGEVVSFAVIRRDV
jgi:hypothetical protein